MCPLFMGGEREKKSTASSSCALACSWRRVGAQNVCTAGPEKYVNVVAAVRVAVAQVTPRVEAAAVVVVLTVIVIFRSHVKRVSRGVVAVLVVVVVVVVVVFETA